MTIVVAKRWCRRERAPAQKACLHATTNGCEHTAFGERYPTDLRVVVGPLGPQ